MPNEAEVEDTKAGRAGMVSVSPPLTKATMSSVLGKGVDDRDGSCGGSFSVMRYMSSYWEGC